jgi:F-type H+-transporting ATPase subunit alpha
MIIYAVTNGFIDDVPTGQVREWERNFHEYMAASYPQVGQGIRTSKVLSKEIEADLRRGIEAYQKTIGKQDEPIRVEATV